MIRRGVPVEDVVLILCGNEESGFVGTAGSRRMLAIQISELLPGFEEFVATFVSPGPGYIPLIAADPNGQHSVEWVGPF